MQERACLRVAAARPAPANRPAITPFQTILKLTSGFTGTHPSTFERRRAWAHRIASHESAFETQLVAGSHHSACRGRCSA